MLLCANRILMLFDGTSTELNICTWQLRSVDSDGCAAKVLQRAEAVKWAQKHESVSKWVPLPPCCLHLRPYLKSSILSVVSSTSSELAVPMSIIFLSGIILLPACLEHRLKVKFLQQKPNAVWPWFFSAVPLIALSTAYAVLWWSGDVFGEQLTMSVAEFVMSLAVNVSELIAILRKDAESNILYKILFSFYHLSQ